MVMNFQEIYTLYEKHPMTETVEYPLYGITRTQRADEHIAAFYWANIWLIVTDILLEMGIISETASLLQLAKDCLLMETCTDVIYDMRKEWIGLGNTEFKKEKFSFESAAQQCLFPVDCNIAKQKMDTIQKIVENDLDEEYLSNREMLCLPMFMFDSIGFYKILALVMNAMYSVEFNHIKGVGPWLNLIVAYEIACQIHDKWKH